MSRSRNLQNNNLSTPINQTIWQQYMPPSKQQQHRTHLADMYTVKASEEEEHCQHNDKSIVWSL
jgi:hypothetical protein